MMLAGFESPTAGEIFLDGQPITRTPPHKRNFGMVFQNYALFPHLTVADNVAYPLTVRKRAESRDRAAQGQAALDMVQLGGMRPALTRRSCRAASSSAWPWRARWCSSRNWC